MAIPMAGVRELTALQACSLEGTVGEIQTPDQEGPKGVRAGGLEAFVDPAENVVSIRDPQRLHLSGPVLLVWPAQKGRIAMLCRGERS
jgi:hypothetical protein